MPRRIRSCTGTSDRSRERKTMRPATGFTIPPTALTSEDLPAPFGPTMPTISPSSTRRSMPSTARKGPSRMVMPESSSIDAAQIFFDDALIRQNFRRRAIGNLFSRDQYDYTIGELTDHLHRVLDDENSAAGFQFREEIDGRAHFSLSLIHISEPTR